MYARSIQYGSRRPLADNFGTGSPQSESAAVQEICRYHVFRKASRTGADTRHCSISRSGIGLACPDRVTFQRRSPPDQRLLRWPKHRPFQGSRLKVQGHLFCQYKYYSTKTSILDINFVTRKLLIRRHAAASIGATQTYIII